VEPQPARGGCPFLARRLEDPELRARVEAAERLGISLRRFDGWEPVEETVYEYDEQGRLVRSVTTRDSEWDDEQQGWMLALAVWRANRCPNCGRDIRECTDESADWHVPPPTRCHVTTALAIAQQQYYRDSPHPHALLWRVERR